MQKLTRAEEQLMQVLWDLERAFLKDIMESFPEPKPAQSTVSTILRILEQKGFVEHETYGKSFQYYPLISKGEYAKFYFRGFLGNYFDGSFQKLLSFFHREGELDLQELDRLMEEVDETEDDSRA